MPSQSDIRQQVTDQILTSLKNGVAPWKKPSKSLTGPHRNVVSSRSYSGVNILLCEIAAQRFGFYDLELQQKCLDIRRTGIGLNGPVLLNRKAKANTKKARHKLASDHADLLDALKSQGLQTTAEVVDGALRELFPSGWTDVDEGQRVRQVFLHLQRKK